MKMQSTMMTIELSDYLTVDINHFFPLIKITVLHGCIKAQSSAVDHDIHRTQRIICAGHQIKDLLTKKANINQSPFQVALGLFFKKETRSTTIHKKTRLICVLNKKAQGNSDMA